MCLGDAGDGAVERGAVILGNVACVLWVVGKMDEEVGLMRLNCVVRGHGEI